LLQNHVREWRLKKNFTSEETAHAAQVTRQALGQIESGKVCPSTAVAIRLSEFFGCAVEELFYEDNLTIDAKLVDNESKITSPYVYLSKIDQQWIARGSSPASNYDLFARTHGTLKTWPQSNHNAKTQVHVTGDTKRMAQTIYISGCDVGLGYLAAFTRNQVGSTDFVWFNTTNQQALYELKNRQTHIAAVHFASEANELPEAWLSSLTSKIKIFEFASADIGWITKPQSNRFLLPDRSMQLADIRIVNRPRGAGSRAILDTLLLQNGISQAEINGYQNEVGGHLSVANAISDGFADAGIGHAAAAFRFGLSFTPVKHERCVLIIREEDFQNQRIEQLMTTLCSGSFRQGLATFGPYEVSNSGTNL
jgi:putative molybdopterin biosynthesis protein